MIELFFTVQCLEDYCTELGTEVWPIWQKRLEHLCKKSAFQYSWNQRLRYAESIYNHDYVAHVNKLIPEDRSHSSRTICRK